MKKETQKTPNPRSLIDNSMINVQLLNVQLLNFQFYWVTMSCAL